MKFYKFIIILIFSNNLIAQTNNLLTNNIDEINYSVARIEAIKKGRIVATATGFFYKNNSDEYLITNRHVVIDSSQKYFPDKLKLKLHISNSDLSKNNIIEISLYDKNGIKNWLEHKDYNVKKIDIVAIPLSKQTLLDSNYTLYYKSKINLFSSTNGLMDYSIQSFGNAVVIGYPLGISDTLNNLPIYRNAMIASQFGIKFNGADNFLIDAKIHPGMSGSPVISSPNNLLKKNNESIHSSSVVLLGILSSGNGNLELNYIWYSYLIEEIIKK
jgi:hypothetical protein